MFFNYIKIIRVQDFCPLKTKKTRFPGGFRPKFFYKIAFMKFRQTEQTCVKVNDFTCCWVPASVSGKTPDLLFVVCLFFLLLPLPPKNACQLLVGNSWRLLKPFLFCWNHRQLKVSSSFRGKLSSSPRSVFFAVSENTVCFM